MEVNVLKVKIENMTKESIDEVIKIEELVNPKHHWSKDSFLLSLYAHFAIILHLNFRAIYLCYT